MQADYHNAIKRLGLGVVNTTSEQHFVRLCSPSRLVAFTREVILAGWDKGELVPLDARRGLKGTGKTPAEPLEARDASIRGFVPVTA
jgi:hypothetical protein